MNQSSPGRASVARLLAASAIALLTMCLWTPARTSALSYYWDNNGATAGFGSATGTWAVPTVGDGTQGWSTDSAGTSVPVNVTTTTADLLNFGNGGSGLGAGTISVSGTVSSGGVTFASGSGAITLSGGTINLAPVAVITVDNASDTITSILSGAGTSFTKSGTGTLTLNTGTNTFGGSILVSQGTLSVTAIGSGSGNYNRATTISAGATYNYVKAFGVNPAFSNPFTINGTMNITGNGTVTFNNTAPITGAGLLTSGSAGGLTLNGNNSGYSGAITFAGAGGGTNTLTLGHANALGTGTFTMSSGQLQSSVANLVNAGNNAIVLGGNFTFQGSNNLNLGTGNITVGAVRALTINTGLTLEFGGNMSGAGGITKGGAGTLILGGTNTNTGAMRSNGGLLEFGTSSIGTGNLIIGGGIFGLNGNLTGRTIGTGANQVQWAGSGGFAAFGATRNVQFSGSAINWTATNFIGANTLILGNVNADATLNWQQAINLAGGARTVQVNNGSADIDAIMSGVINGGSGGNSPFTKTGGGTLAFKANNSYSGDTFINAGRLMLGDGTGNVGGISTNSANVTIGAGATLAVNRTGNLSQGANTGLGDNAIISGDGAFAQIGTGTTTLTLANTYTGGTTVNAGILRANNSSGSATGTGNVIVNNGGTFGGTGSIDGDVILNLGATLSPGASIESLATGSNVWNGGSFFDFEFSTDGNSGAAGTEWDLLAITGTLDLLGASAGSPVTLNLFTMVDANTPGLLGTWDPNVDHAWAGFVTTTGGITGYAVDKFVIDVTGFVNTLNGAFSVVQNGNNLDLVYVAAFVPVPEPASITMLALVGVAFLGRRRHKA